MMAKPIRYRIEHLSHYHYQHAVRDSVMALCLQPRTDAHQRVLAFRTTLIPSASLSGEQDCFGNWHHYFNVYREHQELQIVAHAEIELLPSAPLPTTCGANAWAVLHSWQHDFELWDFTHPSALTRPSPALVQFLQEIGISRGDDPLQSLQQLNTKLFECFQYQPGSTSVESSIERILTTKQGVCQDYAHVMIAIARAWGIPTRYVSGYLGTTGQLHEQAPSTATHAWVEALLPTLGWVGFDPTNCTQRDTRHVSVAVGRDYRDVAPTRGTRQGGGETRLDVEVRVQRC